MPTGILIFYDKHWLTSFEDEKPILRLRISEIAAYKLTPESNTSVWLKGTDRAFEIKGNATETLDKLFGLDHSPPDYEVPTRPS